jgi:hypothetical protein
VFYGSIIRLRSRGSVVGIATRYGLEGSGIESRWGEIFRTYPDRLRDPPSLLYNGYRLFPRGEGGRGVMLTTHPVLVPKLRKSWAIPPLTLWVLLGLLRGSLYSFIIRLKQQQYYFPKNNTNILHLCDVCWNVCKYEVDAAAILLPDIIQNTSQQSE